jgi:hypothetical protein
MKKFFGAVAITCLAFGCSSSSDGDANANGSDAGTPSNDAGSQPSDAASPTGDSGSPVKDAGSAPVDPRDGPGIFAGVGNHVRHIRSLDDGATWVDDATIYPESDTGDLYGIRTVAWVNGQFAAFAAKMLTSPDGKTWTEITKADGQWLASMIYAQGEYVSSGGYGWLATTTTDLGTWTQHPPSMNYTAAHHSRQALAVGMVGGSFAYVSVDDLGNIFHATDGKTWMTTTGAPVVAAGSTWGTVFAYGNGVFVGLLPNGMDSIRSTDGGATWTSNTALATAAQGLVYAQGKFTAVGAGHVFTSTDGQTWTDHPEATAIASDLTYGHGVYLALNGNNGAIYKSTDGLTFTKVFDNATNPDPIATIAFGPNP